MTDYTNALNNIRFSYSSFTTFETCPLLWKMTYLEKIERNKNFYSDVGLIFHKTLEQYFKGNIESYELLPYYKEHYGEVVTSEEPPFPKGIGEKYYQDGIKFFSEFDFPREEYEILKIEDKTETIINNTGIVIIPDLLLRNKETKKVILLDYKTSNPYDQKGKLKKEKILPYIRQLHLYASILWAEEHIEVEQIWIWFVRFGKFEKFIVDAEKAANNLTKFLELAENIRNEKEFPANTTNKFFCQNFCANYEDCLEAHIG